MSRGRKQDIKQQKSSKKDKQSLPPIRCKGCNTLFIPKDRRQRFHSEKCREELYSKVYFKQKTANKKCPNCGIVFPTTMPLKQIYCNEQCKLEFQKKSRDGLIEEVSSTNKKFLQDRYATLVRYRSRCSVCGKDVSDGIKLSVVEDSSSETGYITMCSTCTTGKDIIGAEST